MARGMTATATSARTGQQCRARPACLPGSAPWPTRPYLRRTYPRSARHATGARPRPGETHLLAAMLSRSAVGMPTCHACTPTGDPGGTSDERRPLPAERSGCTSAIDDAAGRGHSCLRLSPRKIRKPNAANTRTVPTLAISRSVKWCMKNRMSTLTTTAISAQRDAHLSCHGFVLHGRVGQERWPTVTSPPGQHMRSPRTSG